GERGAQATSATQREGDGRAVLVDSMRCAVQGAAEFVASLGKLDELHGDGRVPPSGLRAGGGAVTVVARGEVGEVRVLAAAHAADLRGCWAPALIPRPIVAPTSAWRRPPRTGARPSGTAAQSGSSSPPGATAPSP